MGARPAERDEGNVVELRMVSRVRLHGMHDAGPQLAGALGEALGHLGRASQPVLRARTADEGAPIDATTPSPILR